MRLKSKLRHNLLWAIGLALGGCASMTLPKALDTVKIGMDKDQVLSVAGNPQRTYRQNSEDHWQYEYYIDNRLFRREVIFDEGKVLKVLQPRSKEEWVKDLENSETMEEFEAKAREHQKKTDGQFKSVDGEPDEPPKK